MNIKVGTLEHVRNSATAQVPECRGLRRAAAGLHAEPNRLPHAAAQDRRRPPRAFGPMAGTTTDSRVVSVGDDRHDGAVKELRTVEAASPAFEDALARCVNGASPRPC
jgi:hypothetical protein